MAQKSDDAIYLWAVRDSIPIVFFGQKESNHVKILVIAISKIASTIDTTFSLKRLFLCAAAEKLVQRLISILLVEIIAV